MKRNSFWKRTAAGILAVCLVFGSVPMAGAQVGLFDRAGIVANAAPEVDDTWTVKECTDAAELKSALQNAKDGEIIKLKNDIDGTSLRNNPFYIASNCLVTLDLCGHTITFGNGGDVFGVDTGSALLIKNGEMDYFDTYNDHSAGIIILSNVKVKATAWWGKSTGWVLNNSSIASCQTESASINKGASDNLNPRGNNFNGSYNYENPAPAIIGSGASWYCYETLDDDFKNVDSTTKNRVFLLKDSTMTEDADLSVSGVTMDFSECTLTTGTNSFSVSNSGDGQNILRNGKIIGDLTLTSGDGGVALSNLTVTGTIKNKAHPFRRLL